jgi:hypothetical protein
MFRIQYLIAGFFLLLVSPVIMKAQYGSFGLTDARQLALGNTYASNSRELYAAGKNPSLLAWQASDRKLDILFPNLSARAYNVTKVLNFIDDFFSQRPLDLITSIDGSIIKRAIESNGKLYFNLQIGYLAAGYTQNEKIGSFSIAVKDYLNAYLQVPTKLSDYNNGEQNFSGVYFKDFGFTSSWTRALELSYGRMFHTDPGSGITAIYGGIGLKYLTGFIYRKINISAGAGYEDENGILVGAYTASSKSATSDDIDFENAFEGEAIVDNVPFMDPVGKGFSFDAGITLLVGSGVKVGVSLTDVGFINWKGKTKQSLVSGIIRIDSTFDIADIDSLANSITIEKEISDDFQTKSPGAIHIGFSFMVDRLAKNFPGEMNLAVELHQSIVESLENPDQPRLALGLDWKPGKNWPIFLTGISNGLMGEMAWSVGIGYELKFLELYVSTPNIIPKFESSDLQSLSISACWHFVKPRKSKN